MKDKIKQFINTKEFHICMIATIMVAILFILGITILKYNVEGETNLPFDISKISIISNVEGIDVENSENKWELDVNQNNDIYLYIKKNDEYKDIETIKSIRLENSVVTKVPQKGNIKLFKPEGNVQSVIFKNIAENEVDKIEYIGDTDSSIKDLKISNQGGLVVFRYAVDNLGKYTSNEDAEINHSELLKKIGITNEEIKFSVSFDIIMELDSRKTYKSNINLEFPINDVVNQGMQSVEYTNMEDIVFKRI